MTRLERKNRTDIILINKGGMLDLIDNAIKEVWRINDEEFDYIVDVFDDEDLELFTIEVMSISEKRRILTKLDEILTEFYKNK